MWIGFICPRIGRNEALYSTQEFLQKIRKYRLILVDTLLLVWLIAWIII